MILWFKSCTSDQSCCYRAMNQHQVTQSSISFSVSVSLASLRLSDVFLFLSLGLDSGHGTQRGEVWIELQRRSGGHQSDERGDEFSRSVSLQSFPLSPPPPSQTQRFVLSPRPSFMHSVGSCEADGRLEDCG